MHPMRYRRFGGTGWDVSEVGYGMWGMAGWTGSDDEESLASLDRAVALGCNFFDTAWAYGDGHSERLLGQTLKRHRRHAPVHRDEDPAEEPAWPARPEYALDDVYPPDYIREYTENEPRRTSACRRSTCSSFTSGATRGRTTTAGSAPSSKLKEEGLVRAIGISINRWQPANVLRALDTGLIDAVQVVYNVFDQNPEDELFPACREQEHRGHRARAVRRRQPDRHADRRHRDGRKGTSATSTSGPRTWSPTLARVERLRPVVPPG